MNIYSKSITWQAFSKHLQIDLFHHPTTATTHGYLDFHDHYLYSCISFPISQTEVEPAQSGQRDSHWVKGLAVMPETRVQDLKSTWWKMRTDAYTCVPTHLHSHTCVCVHTHIQQRKKNVSPFCSYFYFRYVANICFCVYLFTQNMNPAKGRRNSVFWATILTT